MSNIDRYARAVVIDEPYPRLTGADLNRCIDAYIYNVIIDNVTYSLLPIVDDCMLSAALAQLDTIRTVTMSSPLHPLFLIEEWISGRIENYQCMGALESITLDGKIFKLPGGAVVNRVI